MADKTKYIGIFREEAAEHLDSLSLGLLELELSAGDKELIHGLLRAAHTLKGSAKMLGLEQIGEVAHKMEDLFKAVEDGEIPVSAETIDALLAGTDSIKEIMESVGKEGGQPPDTSEVLGKLLSVLEGAEKSGETAGEPVAKRKPGKKTGKKAASAKKEKAAEVMEKEGIDPPRAAEAKTAPEEEPAEGDAEESAVAVEEEERVPEEAEKSPSREAIRRYGRQERDTIRVDTRKLDDLLTVAGELLINRTRIESHYHNLRALLDEMENIDLTESRNGGDPANTAEYLRNAVLEAREKLNDIYQNMGETLIDLDLYSRDIRDHAMNLRVLPASVLFDEFYRTVRDFSRELHKEIRLEVSGGETELDKQLIEGLRPPLIHIIRNSCDHGIEKPEERKAKGKPPEGVININAYHKGHNVIVEVSDDGRGIDPELVRDAAVEKGIISRAAADEMPDEEALYLILKPGFSTTKIITDFSGRGVGMDVVKTNMERIKGDIRIESERDKYTRIILTAPLTLSILNALLVQVRQDIYAIPLTYVEEAIRLPVTAVFTEAGRDVFNLRGEVIPLVRLENLLVYEAGPGLDDIPEKIAVVVLKFRNQQLGLIVDSYLRDQEIVVKSMGDFLGEIPFVGGATVLRYGEPTIILNVFDIFAAAERWSEVGIKDRFERAMEEKPELKILVVDDSITTRMMEKSILEAAGYNVDLAVSGEEAEEKLRQNDYNLVVTDVEMPGIDGFELTRRIREWEKTREMPVVVVTSLASDEDKRKGVEVGAQAYIVKGTFDQTTLLDTVKSLIS